MDSYQQLISDLTELGFPHPKRANIALRSYGVVEFSWSIERNENSCFVKNLVKRVSMFQEGQLQTQKGHLSITSMSIREDYDYDPSLELHVPVSAPLKFAKPVKRSTGQNQSQNKYPSLSTPTARTLGERFHPYNRPYNRPSGSIAFSQQDDNTVSQAPQSKLVKPASSSQKGAERFLSEVKQSLRVQPRPKEEPIETIPSPVPTTPPAPAAQRRASWVQRQNSSPELQIKREQVSPSLTFSTPQNDHARPYIDLTRESADPSSSRSPYPYTFDKIPVAGDQIASPGIPGMTYSQLRNELFDLRDEISAARGRQNIVVEKLRSLGAEHIPSEFSLSSLTEAKAETEMRVHSDELEKELEVYKAKQIELVKELQVEKLLRLQHITKHLSFQTSDVSGSNHTYQKAIFRYY
ncbi:hypothetical protein Ac2012v2_008280 [Leucoagaricus gongylophorus]